MNLNIVQSGAVCTLKGKELKIKWGFEVFVGMNMTPYRNVPSFSHAIELTVSIK